MIILINKNGYIQGPYINDATIEKEISEDTAEKLRKIPIGKCWRLLEDGSVILEDILTDDVLRARRQVECFILIDNKSKLWYAHLTEQQNQELDSWYTAWLNVTETKTIPTKPDWLS